MPSSLVQAWKGPGAFSEFGGRAHRSAWSSDRVPSSDVSAVPNHPLIDVTSASSAFAKNGRRLFTPELCWTFHRVATIVRR